MKLKAMKPCLKRVVTGSPRLTSVSALERAMPNLLSCLCVLQWQNNQPQLDPSYSRRIYISIYTKLKRTDPYIFIYTKLKQTDPNPKQLQKEGKQQQEMRLHRLLVPGLPVPARWCPRHHHCNISQPFITTHSHLYMHTFWHLVTCP